MANLTTVGDIVGHFAATAPIGYPGKSHSQHWKVNCLRCGSEYHEQGILFRKGKLHCDLRDYARFSPDQLTTLESVLKGPVRSLREYKKWLDMKNRCKNREQYRSSGIRVSDCWQSDFVQFFRDAGPQLGPDFVLDRYPDGAGHYQPGNVRWATPRQSNENRLWATKEPARTT